MLNTLFFKTLLWLRSEMLDESHFKPAEWLVTDQATLQAATNWHSHTEGTSVVVLT